MTLMVDFDERLRGVEQQITTHEAVCAERYAGILRSTAELQADVHGLNKLLIKIGLALITGMAGILIKLTFFA